MTERNKVNDAIPKESTRKRKWEVFPGRNLFCCDGRVMKSRNMGIFYFTLFLVFGTSGCFFAFDGRNLWSTVSPAIPIFAVLQMIFVVSTLCRTGFGDPGIIPRATPAEAEALDKWIEEENNKRRVNGEPLTLNPPRIKKISVKGLEVELKYCHSCKIFRPPRASHCSVCDNCVDRFDHHCPWVGNCIGKRNYKYFYLFLTSATFYCTYLIAVTILGIVLYAQTVVEFRFELLLKSSPLSIVVIVVAIFSLLSAGGMGCYHTYLVALGTTTNEEIKKTFKRSSVGNPFAAGNCCMNFIDVVCRIAPPSLLDNRGWVDLDVELAYEEAARRNEQSDNVPSQNFIGATFGPVTDRGISAAPRETNTEQQPLAPNTTGVNNAHSNPQPYPARLPPLEHPPSHNSVSTNQSITPGQVL